MGKFTLVVFPDEMRGKLGFSALEALHLEGSIPLRGLALLERDEDGLLLLRKDSNGTLLGGGLGAVVGRAPAKLLEFLVCNLAPKTFALVAEGAGEWIDAIAGRMEPLGGRVVSEWATESGDDALERQTTRQPDLAARSAAAESSLEARGRRR
jgi:hypothetical protein